MLLLSFKGRLGNQMFQYAAVRTLADRKGFAMSFNGPSLELADFFALRAGQTKNKLLLKIIARTALLPHKFTPRYGSYQFSVGEKFDETFFEIQDGTLITGWLQSIAYFADNDAAVREWFQLTPHFRALVDQAEQRITTPPAQRCCLHVRVGDYADLGFSLPVRYYQKALEHVPPGLSYVVITDDPGYVKREFSFLPDLQILEKNPGIVDLSLMSRCRYNVIANSSFSFWAAWLNQVPDRVVIAPKYYMGWNTGEWNPDRIEVPGWNYVDVMK